MLGVNEGGSLNAVRYSHAQNACPVFWNAAHELGYEPKQVLCKLKGYNILANGEMIPITISSISSVDNSS
jgi:hypothetical protein